MTVIRNISALTLTLTLAACGGSGEVVVREGPQEVHPAPPAISHFDNNGCHSHSGKGCHSHPHDGSKPFIH